MTEGGYPRGPNGRNPLFDTSSPPCYSRALHNILSLIEEDL